MAELADVVADLQAESAELDALVAPLHPGGWARASAAPGWTIGHQIGHLAWTDDVATLSATDPAAFARMVEAAAADGRMDTYVDRAAEDWAQRPDLLDVWRHGRDRLAAALVAVPPGTRLPWFGPPMSPMSMATARLMETWAHSQDVADALGVERRGSERLRHVAHLGVRTRDFAFRVRGGEPPAEQFRIDLTGPGGEVWAWGPDDAEQRVSGPALDFCLLVTQRRHRDDLDLVAEGADADRWLSIAQAFAGPPGSGRRAGQSA